MSTNQTRKPSAAAESFITAIAILFFASLAVLFLWLDNRKRVEKQTQSSSNQNQGSSLSMNQNETKEYSPVQIPNENVERSLSQHGVNAYHIANFESEQGIDPPLPALDLSPQLTTINAATGQIITSGHRSVITIPPYAFLDKDGKTVTGDVRVRYREFYNFLDIFLSGIPMKYGDAQLESAGMFEFTASNNDGPLYANPENKINIMMSSLKNSPGYYLYYFDQNQNKWIQKGNSSVTASGQGAQGWQVSNTSYDSTEKIFTYTPDDYHVRLYSVMEPAPKRKFLQLKKSSPDRFSFHFAGSQKTIPELNGLRTITWCYTGQDALNVYRALFGLKNIVTMTPRPWKNLILEHVDADDTYLLTLFDNDDTIDVKIIPRLNSENAQEKFNARFAAFSEAQHQRRMRENTSFQKFKDDTSKYYAENGHYVLVNQTADMYAMRQFELDGFGVWNCDRPVQMPVSKTVIASFTDQNGNLIKPVRVFLADKSVNTVYSYDERTIRQFRFNPASRNLVWALFPGDVVVAIRPKEFQEKYAQSVTFCNFKVEIDNNAVVSKEGLKKQLVFDL